MEECFTTESHTMFVTGILFLVTIAFTEAQETTTPAAEDAVTISIDDQLLTFTGQYCTGADPALGNVFRTALRCIESESVSFKCYSQAGN